MSAAAETRPPAAPPPFPAPGGGLLPGAAFGGLRARLLMLVALTLALPIIVTSWQVDQHAVIRTQAVEQQMTAAADGIAREQLSLVTQARAMLGTAAQLSAAWRNGPDCRENLQNLLAATPWARGLGATDATGRIVCAADPAGVGLAIGDRQYFQQAMQSRQFVLSDLLLSRILGELVLVAAQPILGPDGQFQGVMFAPLNLEWLGRLAEHERVGAGVDVALVIDSKGMLVARQPPLADGVGRDFSDTPLVRAMLASPEGAIRQVGLDGVRRVYGFVRLPGSGAALAVGRDETAVLGPARREAVLAYGAMLTAALAAAVLAWWFGKAVLLRGLEAIVATARDGGVMAQLRPDPRAAVEVHVLHQALVENERRRAASEASFRLLAEHSGDVVALADIDGTRRYVSPAVSRILGWQPASLVGRPGKDFAHPDDLGTLQAATELLQTGAPESVATYRHRRPDGGWTWVDGRARAFSAGDGSGTTGYVVVLRDATERKANEARLAEAFEAMQRMAATDALTGLANRGRFDDALEHEWRRAGREARPLSVLLLDVDHFKRFNDRYGHPAGDRCLRTVATTLDGVARRPGDVTARYGGEEFALIMPNTDTAGALHVAERLRARIEAAAIPHAGNEPLGVVTASLGVATAWPATTPGEAAGDQPGAAAPGPAELLAAADAALYRAKGGGRNRVTADALLKEAGATHWAGLGSSTAVH